MVWARRGTIKFILQRYQVGNDSRAGKVSFRVLGDDQLGNRRFDDLPDSGRLTAGDMKRTGVELSNQLLSPPQQRGEIEFEGIAFQIEIVVQVNNVGAIDAGKRLLAIAVPVEIPFKRTGTVGDRIQNYEPRLPRGMPLQGVDYADRAAGERRQR